MYNYNYYPQQMQSNVQPQNSYNRQPLPFFGLKGRPVSSLEEARVTNIDFDGSIFYFPDVANKCIYTKQINMDGTATVNLYELKEIPVDQPKTTPSLGNYITREEFENAIAQIKASIAPTKTVTEPPAPPKMEVLSF
jgi:hypothetical protein